MHEYKQIGSIETFGSEGEFGLRLMLSAPPEMMKVFDFEATRATPEAFISPSRWIEEFMEALFMANARLDPAVHKSRAQARAEVKAIFELAGLAPIHMTEIPSEYCNKHCCLGRPWFIVVSRIGPIKIGWRKRVINIDWSASDVTAKPDALFAAKDVTKGDRGDSYIHAWGVDQAVEFLTVLKEASHAV